LRTRHWPRRDDAPARRHARRARTCAYRARRSAREARSRREHANCDRRALSKTFERADNMQTATVALTEEQNVEEPTIHPLPSMDELMAGLDKLESETNGSQPSGGDVLARVTLDEGDGREMIAPELVFPVDEYDDDDHGGAAALDAARGPISRLAGFPRAPQP